MLQIVESPAGPSRRRADVENEEDLARLFSQVAEHQDKAAFAALFSHFGPRIKGFMMRKGAAGDLAEDLAQETMLTVWRKASTYCSEKGSVATWIFTIARNRRIDWIRRANGVVYTELGDVDEASDDPSAEDRLNAHQEAELVSDAVERLPQEQKAVVSMAFMEHMSHTDISQRLGIPVGTVKSRMRLAYKKLSESLEGL